MSDTKEATKKGRPPLPEGQRRAVFVQTRIKATAAERFKAKCQEKGISTSDALRQALSLWMKS